MKFIHTADGPAPTQAEVAFFEQAGHKLALGMQEGSTRRSFETVGSTSAYLIAGTPGAVHIHTVKDDPKISLANLIASIPNSFGPRYTPPDFVSGFIHADGRTKVFEDAETGCNIPQLFPEPTVHTEYVSPEYAARKLATVGGKIYGATAYPPADDPEKGITYSQASRKRPGYFTGHMAAVVQMMLGGGRFLSPSVYKLAGQQKKIKNAVGGMQIGFDARTGKADEPPNPSHYQYMKPFEEGKCVGTANTNDPFAMEVPWDYRWFRTHGIMFGLDKTIEGTHSVGFIIDISNLGVYAYPVQVDPLTKYRKVQQYMAKVYPWLNEPVFNGMNVFDAFGGVPLPTYFIRGDLDAAVTKGSAVRICDTSQFYSGGEFMSTMFGWAFSETTGEAANITVKDPDGEKMKVSQLFKLKVKGLQLAKEKGEDNKTRVVVKGSGGIVKIKEGSFYNAGRPSQSNPCMPTGAPQFHIYEPVIGEMISYDLRYGRVIRSGKCDAPMFCSYIKDDLHVLNYFAESGGSPTTYTSDTREPCQHTGTWTDTTVTNAIKVGHWYNSHTDFRKEIAESRSKTVTKQWPAYDYDVHSQVDFFSVLCFSQHHYFHHTDAKWEMSGSEGWAANVGTSSTDRSVYFVCTLHTKGNGVKGHSTGIVYSGIGPEVRYFAFYYFITHWAGGVAPAPDASCMEPTSEFIEANPGSCFTGGTESMVGKVKHYSLFADGTETCAYYAGMPTGGHYTGKGVLGNWIGIGGYEAGNHPGERFTDPYISNVVLTNQHEAAKRVYIFGAPLANGRMIAEYKATAPAEDVPFGLEYAHDWFRFSLPSCPVMPMPVCRNFYGKDFMSTYNDRSWSAVVNFGSSPGLGPTAIPVGGIMK